MSLEQFLEDLGRQDVPVRYAELLRLSSLSSEEFLRCIAAWNSMPDARKLDVVNRLVLLSEDNPELDFTTVLKECLRDAYPDVREKAAEGLWECEDRVMIRPLLELLDGDPSPRVRCAAATCLGRFALMAVDGKLLERDAARVKDALLHAVGLPDPDAEVVRRSLEALGAFQGTDVEEIISRAYGSLDLEMRRSALFAMGRNGAARWVPALLEDLRHDVPAIRYEAAVACGEIGGASSVPHLIELLGDGDPQVEQAAIRALGALGGPMARRALSRCLQCGDEALEEAAREAISELDLEGDPLGTSF